MISRPQTELSLSNYLPLTKKFYIALDKKKQIEVNQNGKIIYLYKSVNIRELSCGELK